MPESLRSVLNPSRLAIGLSVNFASPDVIELGAIAGFDFCNIDAEHGPLGIGDISAMTRAADARGVPSLVRPANSDPSLILRVLDTGAGGVMVPNVKSGADAEAAVRSVKYPPLGERGLGVTRSNDWGYRDASAYVIEENERTAVVALVENIEGVEKIDEIVGIQAVDVVWIGPADLAQSMGITGHLEDPMIGEAIDLVIASARATGKGVGVGVSDASKISSLVQRGFTCLAVQARSLIVDGGQGYVRALESVRRS